MSDNHFDALSKLAAKSVNRRDTLRGMAAVLGGALLAAVGGKSAFAMPPRTCVTCVCGTGKPCNPKSTTCTEVRDFPANTTCTEACQRQGQNLCSVGNSFHCPRGCPE
jgi:hypothetical protein